MRLIYVAVTVLFLVSARFHPTVVVVQAAKDDGVVSAVKTTTNEKNNWSRQLSIKSPLSQKRRRPLEQQQQCLNHDTSIHHHLRRLLLKFDVVVGILYSTMFLLFPGQTLSAFFKYSIDEEITPFLHMAVRMVAINHFGYIAGLATAPEEKAIQTATAFIVVGGAVVVYYGQARLDVQWMFLTCTFLTTAMIVAHLIALLY
jgi:hypothetical protein